VELKFKQKELSFLSLYAQCSDTKTDHGNKFQILSIENSTDLIFVQCGIATDLVSIVKNKNINKEKIILTYESSKFSDILKYCDAESDIIITDKHINFGKSSKYTFESFDFSTALPVTDILSVIENKDKYKSNEFFDLDKIALIKSYAGDELQGLNLIGFFDNYFITSNRSDGTGIVKTKNSINSNYYFPIILYNICQYMKINSVTVYDIPDRKAFMIYNNWVYILFGKSEEQIKLEEKRYEDLIFPNLLSPEIKGLYYHKNFITIKKAEILNVLKKMSIVAKEKFGNRVFITLVDQKIIIETRDLNECLEQINYSVPKELFNILLVISVNFAISMISSIPGDSVVIRIPNDKDNIRAISFMDIEENIMYVQTVHEESCIVK
jgi:hypothetical protein